MARARAKCRRNPG